MTGPGLEVLSFTNQASHIPTLAAAAEAIIEALAKSLFCSLSSAVLFKKSANPPSINLKWSNLDFCIFLFLSASCLASISSYFLLIRRTASKNNSLSFVASLNLSLNAFNSFSLASLLKPKITLVRLRNSPSFSKRNLSYSDKPGTLFGSNFVVPKATSLNFIVSSVSSLKSSTISAVSVLNFSCKGINSNIIFLSLLESIAIFLPSLSTALTRSALSFSRVSILENSLTKFLRACSSLGSSKPKTAA